MVNEFNREAMIAAFAVESGVVTTVIALIDEFKDNNKDISGTLVSLLLDAHKLAAQAHNLYLTEMFNNIKDCDTVEKALKSYVSTILDKDNALLLNILQNTLLAYMHTYKSILGTEDIKAWPDAFSKLDDKQMMEAFYNVKSFGRGPDSIVSCGLMKMNKSASGFEKTTDKQTETKQQTSNQSTSQQTQNESTPNDKQSTSTEPKKDVPWYKSGWAKTVYYATGALALGAGGYFGYKYFTGSDPVDEILITADQAFDQMEF